MKCKRKVIEPFEMDPGGLLLFAFLVFYEGMVGPRPGWPVIFRCAIVRYTANGLHHSPHIYDND